MFLLECKLVTPIFICCLKAEYDCVEELLNYGADPNLLCSVKKIAPLHIAASKGITYTDIIAHCQRNIGSL
jgi:hypothetical protein